MNLFLWANRPISILDWTAHRNLFLRVKISPKPLTEDPLAREQDGASIRSVRVLNTPSLRLKLRLMARARQ